MRGRPAAIIPQECPRKFIKVFEDEDTIETWTYNLDKSNGPILVDIKYKNGVDKKWAKMQKDNIRQKSEMRKIIKAQSEKPKQTRKNKSK
jgi:hypothetical protein